MVAAADDHLVECRHFHDGQTTMHRFSVITALTVLAGTQASFADVYRYTSDEGVECFTDAPTTRATVFIRERKRPPSRMTEDVRPSVKRPDGVPTPQRLPISGRITSHTGLRIDPIDGQLRMHNGVDIAVPQGTPIRPVAEGTVTFSGVRQGYGNTVMIEHDDGLVTLYAHNAENMVTAGTRVDGDTTIALSGSTGRSTGPHLHFEAWRDGENLTMQFAGLPAFSVTPARSRTAAIRKFVDEEGTTVFTNLP